MQFPTRFDGHCEFYTALSDLMNDVNFVRRKDVLDVSFQHKMTAILQGALKKTAPEPKIQEVE